MDVLIDNSLFAGLMREYAPELPAHEAFIKRYPEHRRIDRVSTAQFLNALVLFDGVKLEVEAKQYLSEHDRADTERVEEWAYNLRKLLPESIQAAIEFGEEAVDSNKQEANAILRSVEVYSRQFPNWDELFIDAHIPYVYSSPDYIYRSRFEAQEEAKRLSDRELSHAMFLHRGLRLQETARRNEMIYQPYWYRAEVLAKASPLLFNAQLNDGLYTVQLPGRYNTPQIQNKYTEKLDQAYYSLIEQCTFAKPDHAFPFIGAAIMDTANWNIKDALKEALRQKADFGQYASKWQDLMRAITEGRKLDADDIAASIKRQIENAAGSRLLLRAQPYKKGAAAMFEIVTAVTGVAAEAGTGSKTAGKLAETTLQAIVDAVPDTAKEWFRKQVEEIIEKVSRNPYRMLLTRHLDALADA